MITISRLYDDYNIAARTYNDLERAGISKSDISIVASNAEGWYDEKAREPGRIDTDGPGAPMYRRVLKSAKKYLWW
jgi:hypothetical protein